VNSINLLMLIEAQNEGPDQLSKLKINLF